MSQRGFGLLGYLLGAAAVLGLALGLWMAVDANLVTSAGMAKGVAQGHRERDDAYAKRDDRAKRDAEAELKRLRDTIAVLEDRHNEAVALAGANYDKGVADGRKDLDAAVARVRAGHRLRDPGRRPAPCPADGGKGSGAAPGITAGVGDAATDPQLSAEASEFLLQLAGEADEIARQLGGAQAVMRACYKAFDDLWMAYGAAQK
jgi:hypothetical protein